MIYNALDKVTINPLLWYEGSSVQHIDYSRCCICLTVYLLGKRWKKPIFTTTRQLVEYSKKAHVIREHRWQVAERGAELGLSQINPVSTAGSTTN